MKPVLLLLLAFMLSVSTLNAQVSKVNFDSIPGNTIVIAPFNNHFFGHYNNLYYKRKVYGNGPFMVALRAGFGLSQRFQQELEVDLSETTERRGYQFNFGVEMTKNFGKLSLFYGSELSYTRFNFGEGVEYTIEQADPFAPPDFTVERNFGGEGVRFRMISPIFFLGFKYHVSPRFQIGMESAIGFGFFRLENDIENLISQDQDYTGSSRQLTPGRQLLLEYSF